MAGLGLYDAFKDYIQQQLKIRRAVLSNPRSLTVTNETSESESNVATRYTFDSSNDFQTTSRLGPEQFFAYTTEKRCTIRMASGVDIEESAKNGFLRDYEEYQIGQGLAARFVLEGGVKSTIYNNWTRKELSDVETEKQVEENLANNPKRAGSGDIIFEQDIANVTIDERSETNGQNINLRGGFGSGGAYGDKITRSDANDGYGIVPMPGIKSAKINTVSKEGALREATVDFFCHNRAQLEVLEALYMRPGYVVLLEWGWDPYIGNDVNIENNEFTSLDLFFDPNSDFDILSKKIIQNKKDSSGNYDGFIGYIKNFSYKVREDGGYDCTTELISNNELLESFKAGKRITYNTNSDPTVEDNFLYYLRSIQKNLQKAGDEYYLEFKNTEAEKKLQKEEQFNARQKLRASRSAPNTIAEGNLVYSDAFITQTTNITTDVNKESSAVENKVRELNVIEADYLKGFSEIIDLIKKIKKGNITDLPEKLYDDNSGRGFQAFLNGTLLKQVVQYDEGEEVSGFESHIYVRWDLLTQIMNHLIVDQYKTNKPLAEFTYLNPYAPTTFDLDNIDNKRSLLPDETSFYLSYSAPNNIEKADPILSLKDNNGDLYIEGGLQKTKTRGTGITAQSSDNTYHPLLGNSYDYNICLLPHMSLFDSLFIDNKVFNDPNVADKNPTKESSPVTGSLLTSFEETGAPRESIGLVYFNLEYLISEYSNMRLKSTKSEDEEGTVYTRFRKDFSMLKYLQTIWGSVNNSTGDYYKFDVTTEHERPHILRVIEKNFNRKFNENEVFEFRPQGLESVTRNFMFNSSITNDMASVISIAAQAPKEEQSLEALSFKAFHKNIKSRFTTLELTEKDRRETVAEAASVLTQDVKTYNNLVKKLDLYLKRLGSSNFTSEYIYNEKGEREKKKIISPKTAIMYAQEIEELRISILNRYPLSDLDRAGLYRPNTTHNRSEVIPLEISLQLDGISGLVPYNVFKIHEDKLPYDYGRGDIAFIVKNESQSITVEGDWVTEITGQLVLLNINPNNDGENIIEEVNEEIQEAPNESDILDENEEQQNIKIRFPQNELEISQAGIDSILEEEQFRANAYDDFAPNTALTSETNIIGTLTVGYGTTNSAGVYQARYNTEITNTTTITEPQARELVLDYVNNRKSYLNTYSPGVEFTQGEFDAMMSFLYNTGNGYHSVNGGKPSTIMKMLNAGDYEGASTQFERWNKSKGKVLPGLVRRRKKEKELFLS